MKALLIAAATLGAAIASAQFFGGQSYGYGYTYLPPVYNTAPQVIYLGGRTTASRRESNVPFAYGSFFYGPSWSDWQRSQRRR